MTLSIIYIAINVSFHIEAQGTIWLSHRSTGFLEVVTPPMWSIFFYSYHLEERWIPTMMVSKMLGYAIYALRMLARCSHILTFSAHGPAHILKTTRASNQVNNLYSATSYEIFSVIYPRGNMWSELRSYNSARVFTNFTPFAGEKAF